MTARIGAAAGDDKRHPWIKFYPADWRSDPRLRMCSLAARGLWIELISVMHESDPYGHMVIGGTVPKIPQIAALVSRPLKEVAAALDELRANGVCSVGERGEVYSRRMVRDRAKHVQLIQQGKLGGNPALKGAAKAKDKPPDNPPLNPEVGGPLKAKMLDARDQKGSDADASGAAAPLDPAKLMFDEGVKLLKPLVKSDAEARSIIGKWRRQHGEPAVIDAIGRAVREGSSNPLEFITGCLRSGHGKRPADARPNGFIDALGELARRDPGPGEPRHGGLDGADPGDDD